MVRYTLTVSAGTTTATDVSADLEDSSRSRRRPDRLREVGDPSRPGSDLDRAVSVAVASYGLGRWRRRRGPFRRALQPASAAEAGGDAAVCDLPTVHQHGDRGPSRSSGDLVEGQL